MDINTNIDVLQSPIAEQQFIDSQQNITGERDVEFEQILVKELEPQPLVLKLPSQDLPNTGNELPLDLISSISNDEKTLAFVIEPPISYISAQQSDEKIETPDNIDLSSLMIERLIIDTPNATSLQLPLTPTHKAMQMELLSANVPAEIAAVEITLNEPMNTAIATEQQRIAAISLPFSLAPSKVDEDEVKLNVNDGKALLEEYQPIKLASPIEEKIDINPSGLLETLPVQLQANNVSTSEPISGLIDYKTLQKEPLAMEQTEVIFDQSLVSKEPLKQTMSLPNASKLDEDFAQIFEKKLMDNVNWMVRRNENATSIQIDPPELGRIEISIEQNDDKLDIRFFAQVDQTRQLIENTLDKLKTQFAQSGMELGNVDVNAGNQGTFAEDPRRKEPLYQSTLEEPLVNTMAKGAINQNQLLDLYI